MSSKVHVCTSLESSPDGYAVTIIQYNDIWYLELMESTGPVIIFYCPFCGKNLE